MSRRPGRQALPGTEARNERWAIDFIHDSLPDDRQLRILGVLDTHTRECLSLEVDLSLPSEGVIRRLERLEGFDQPPQRVTVDSGPEFVPALLDR